MERFFKYVAVPIVIFSFLFLATIFVLPLLIDVQKYVPEIENKLSEITGRSVSIGPDMGFSFFPWLGVSFSEMKLGNPHGFPANDFVKIESFEARINFLPLLKKELQISRLVVAGLEINLQTREDGSVNWDFSWKEDGVPTTASATQEGDWYLPEGISISLLAVTDGLVNWNDSINQSHHRIDDLMLLVNSINTDGPTGVDLKASIDGKPVDVEGKIAPIGNKFGKDPLAIDVRFAFLNSLKGQAKGKITNLQKSPGYDLVLEVAPFSPRGFFDVLNVPFPIKNVDPKAFSSLGLNIPVKGSLEQFSIEKGRATLDGTDLEFSLVLTDSSRPDLGFSLDIEKFDLNLYLAPGTDKNGGQDRGGVEGEKVDHQYSVLDNLTLAGAMRIGELKIGGGTVYDITGQVSFADRIFEMDPMLFGLYKGQAQASIVINAQGDVLKTDVKLQSKDVQAALFFDDYLATDFLSGTMSADIMLQFSGDSKLAMKKHLNGGGTLFFKDGALTGVDLARTVGGLKNALSVSEPTDQRARTEFSELVVDITIKNGLIESKKATLVSPRISLLVSGTADLVTEQLDLKFEPQIAETKEGRKNVDESGVVSMPLAISGSFADLIMNTDAAKFSPDEATVQASKETQNLVDKNHLKKRRRSGSGKIHISPLQEETALYQPQ